MAGAGTSYIEYEHKYINSLLILQNFAKAQKKRQHSFDILKSFFSSDTRQGTKVG